MGLELAYNHARDIIGRGRAECLAAAVAVEQLRLAWKPERVQVVVLAESHVWTSRDEIQSRVKLNGKDMGGFARFVYCLGYGEPHLVEPVVTRNSGTPQYWKLFYDTLYRPNTTYKQVMKTGETDAQKRLQNKLDLLEKMQGAGIWLVDASVTALYHNGPKLDYNSPKLAVGRAYHDVLKACWESHVGEVVCGCAPSAILIVGKGVNTAIGDCVRQDLGRDVEVVPQPQARTFGMDDRRACFDFVCRYRA
jgi:hypothetical protein